MTKLLQSQISKLKELNNLFIELTAKNCNQRCKNCYIDFPISKNIKDFIPDDLIKETLSQTKNENIECIYLTGAEPMTHPDFNGILRMCLKRTNVCICTNGSFINEKKARFLKRVEDESDYEIIFQLGIAHYDEIKNDDNIYPGIEQVLWERLSVYGPEALQKILFSTGWKVLFLMNWHWTFGNRHWIYRGINPVMPNC